MLNLNEEIKKTRDINHSKNNTHDTHIRTCLKIIKYHFCMQCQE